MVEKSTSSSQPLNCVCSLKEKSKATVPKLIPNKLRFLSNYKTDKHKFLKFSLDSY